MPNRSEADKSRMIQIVAESLADGRAATSAPQNLRHE